MRQLVIVLTAALLSACATGPRAVSNLPGETQTVAVLSMIPDEAHYTNVTMLRVGNSFDEINASTWDLNGQAFEVVQSVLAPRYEVIRVQEDLSALDSATQGIIRLGNPRLEAVRDQLANAPDADIYIAIWEPELTSWRAQLSAPDGFVGVGVSRIANFVFPEDPYVHAALAITVFDGETLDEIGQQQTHWPPDEQMGQRGSPTLGVFEWNDNFDALSPEQKQQVRTRIEEVLRSTLTYMVGGMFPE